MGDRAHVQRLALKRGVILLFRLGEGDRKHMRNLKLENKNQKVVHIRQVKTSKLEVRSLLQVAGLQLRAGSLGTVEMAWKNPNGDRDKEPRRHDYRTP